MIFKDYYFFVPTPFICLIRNTISRKDCLLTTRFLFLRLCFLLTVCTSVHGAGYLQTIHLLATPLITPLWSYHCSHRRRQSTHCFILTIKSLLRAQLEIQLTSIHLTQLDDVENPSVFLFRNSQEQYEQ